MIKYLELALSQEVYEYLEELDEMNWSARGNVLNQYLRNTSIGTTVNANSCRISFNGCTMTFLGRFSDVSKAWLQCLFSKSKRCIL